MFFNEEQELELFKLNLLLDSMIQRSIYKGCEQPSRGKEGNLSSKLGLHPNCTLGTFFF